MTKGVAGIAMALRRPRERMKIAGCRGSLAGKKLRRYGVPHPWTPAPYRGTGHAFEAVSQVQRAAISAIPTFVFGRFHQ